MVVDACTYADAQIVEDFYLDRLREGKPAARAELRRFRIEVGSGEVTHEQLAEGLELPRINYGPNNERPYRYVWGVDAKSGWFDRIVKADVEGGSTDRVGRGWTAAQASRCSSRRPERGGRGRGRTAVSVVFDASSGRSFLLVLDAADLERAGARRGPAPHPVRLPRAVRRELAAGLGPDEVDAGAGRGCLVASVVPDQRGAQAHCRAQAPDVDRRALPAG